MAQANNKLKTLPIGISNWSQLRKRDMFFVDKTDKLRSLVVAKNKIFLSRPRRMGKSMLCSMLEDLFNNGTRNFEGTAIYDQWPEEAGAYPVIRLTFVDIAGDTKREFEQSLIGALVDAYGNAGFHEVKQYEKEYKTLDRFLKALKPISRNNELVFIIDEWDHPLSSNLGEKAKYNIALSALKCFYSWLRSIDSFRFILVTGIMRYSSASLFTGQDIRDISMDPDYASLVGYTHEELVTCYAPYIKEAARVLGLSEAELIAELQAYYDGFCFDEKAEVKLYSPWDINQFFDRVTPGAESDYHPEFKAFWMNSSNATAALRSYLQRDPLSAESLIDLCRHDITMAYEDLTTPSDFKRITKQQIMLQSGMLTIKEVVADNQNVPPSERMFVCRLTNYDVGAKYATVLTSYMIGVDEDKASPYINQAQEALLSGDIEATCLKLNEMLCLAPYDVMASAQEKLYRSLFALWLRSPAITVQEEVSNNLGRIDLLLTTADHIYVVELKRLAKSSNTAKAKLKLLDTAGEC